MATFEEHVRAALDSLPPELAGALENVAIVVEDGERGGARPLRPLRRAASTCRAKISIYRRPLEEDFPDPAELEEQIRVTVLHELAHYFGIEEDRIADLGYE